VPGVIFTRQLGDNCSWSNARAIGLKSKWEVIVREHQNQGQSDQLFELHEGIFLGQAPDEPNVLHSEIQKCVSMVREPRDKLTVEVDETDKELHLLLVSWGGPVCYTINLDRIYFEFYCVR
jgi:hypothetical protein